MKGKPIDSKKNQLKHANRCYVKNYRKYEEQEKILGERNSYSKTDKDATFMQMKEDSGSGKNPKPGYNLQLLTNGQYVIDYSLHPNPTDTRTLIPQLEEFKKQYGFYPKELTADSGYGSE